MASRRRVTARGMASCVVRSPTTIREVAPGKQPAASASAWECSTPHTMSTGSGGTAPGENPRGDPAMAATKVRRIEAAIAAVGDDDGEEASLQSSLRRARLQAQVPLEKCIADCSQFIERAKKRAESASAALQKAVEFKSQCDDEVAAAEKRLEVLQREVARSDVGLFLPSQPEGPVVKRCRREPFWLKPFWLKVSSNLSLLSRERSLCWFGSFCKTWCVDGSEGMDPHGGPEWMDKFFGVRDPKQRNGTSVCAQFVSRADASAIQGTLEERSLSATTAHHSTSSPICTCQSRCFPASNGRAVDTMSTNSSIARRSESRIWTV